MADSGTGNNADGYVKPAYNKQSHPFRDDQQQFVADEFENLMFQNGTSKSCAYLPVS